MGINFKDNRKKSNEENIRREESSLYKCNIFQRLTVKPNDDDE